MSGIELAGFLALAATAAYIQTLTGFAFGLIMMGGVGLSGVMSLPDAATIVGVLTLTNAGQMMLKGWRDVAYRELKLIMIADLPFLFVGYFLLEWLADTRLDLLRLLLGLVIVAASLQMARKPHPLAQVSKPGSFLFFGSIAGVMGGLFSTGGPPLIYHLYRQPLPLAQIRETLVTVFALNQVFRLSVVGATGNFPTGSTLSGLLAVPVVMGATYAARRWPLPLPPAILRRIVFALLFLSGVSLGAPAVLHMLGGPP
ncbi:sulfite exporter TauE/SafE family protein [Microvirga pudoricolor]|uniref:sulfite exporter TauE/SafE family protein n=1 Tax=Microvirga pudoricolor TaxID=2778729 RepID=UPI0019500B76|nr:sulfite exporter TauE/SafE family protein [Microvirga pudoricolor]MBM6596340.1 sulfite exporter TauE/SafE family protein [Microvirga pudoricolor]